MNTTAVNTIATSEVAHRPDIRVNGSLIDEQRILEEMQYHPAESQQQAMIAAAQQLIIQTLLEQRANALGLAFDNEEDLLEKLSVLDIAIPTPSDAECKQYFSANPERFKTSPILEVDHILLAADKEDLEQREDAKAIAENLLSQLQAQPHLFADFASRYSICPSKQQGGNLGQISKGQTVAEFEKALFLSDEGLLSTPIETRYGFHIVNIKRKVDGQALPYEMVKEKIEHYLLEKVKRKAISQYIYTLIADADIEGFAFDVKDSPLMQ